MLRGRRRLSDKLTASFETHHARRYDRISFKIRRSIHEWFRSHFHKKNEEAQNIVKKMYSACLLYTDGWIGKKEFGVVKNMFKQNIK